SRWRPAGIAGHDRAPARVTAHAGGLAAAGRVWWAPKIKNRASGGLLDEGRPSRPVGQRRPATVRLSWFRTGLSCAVGRGSLLVVAMSWVPRRVPPHGTS